MVVVVCLSSCRCFCWCRGVGVDLVPGFVVFSGGGNGSSFEVRERISDCDGVCLFISSPSFYPTGFAVHLMFVS